MKSILIIEDDFALNNALAHKLRLAGYKVDSAFNAAQSFSYLKNQSYALLILDINLPDGSGFELYPDLKANSNASIIFLTANDLEADMLKGFDLGADDYITKPFSPSVLERKITVLFKRMKEKYHESIFSDGYLHINFSACAATVEKVEIQFTPLEFQVLEYFIMNKKHILRREQLLNHLWDSEGNFVGETSLNAVISRIRKKIETPNHRYIKTIYGTGYMWIGE